MTNYINCTPHAIVLNSGISFQPSGTIARVSASFSELDENLTCQQIFGDVSGLPDPAADTIYIVSGLVLQATTRNDVVAPATGHPNTIRNAAGHIVSVPGFIRN